jgi:hypothetical protein
VVDRPETGGRPLGAALALGAVLCAVPLTARFLTGPAPVAMLAGFTALALLPTVLVAVVAAATRRVTVASVATALVLAQLAVLAPLVASDPAPGGTPLTVMTANLNLGEADAEQVVDAVRRHGVEVLAVQELTVEAERRLEAAGLRSLLPYDVTDPGGSASGTGLWASRPLERLAPWEMTFRSSAAALTVGGRRVVVRSVHPFPPRWSDDSRWSSDLAALRTSIAGDPDRDVTVLLGDLNATAHHRDLTDGRWRDAGELVGAGVVRTWSPRRGVPPLLDLDHVLVPRQLGARRHQVVDVPGSDHEGVVVHLVVPPQ